MRYKIEVLTVTDEKISNRFPSLEDIKKSIDDYSEGFKGLIILHDTLYDYSYDISGSNYHTVDTTTAIGHINSTIIENDKLYINVDLTKQFANMIIAQRAIEANSRVFNTANQVMQSLVYLGQ